MVVHVLSDQRGAPSSENLSNVARKQSKEKEQAGHRHAVYNLLAITAAFKEKSRIFNSAEDAPYYSKEDFKYGEMNWQINDGNATMSIHDQPPKCGIIEWKYYKDEFGEDSPILENNIKRLAKFLCADGKPGELLVLPCLGIIKDRARSRYGFIFQPPSYIGDLKSLPKSSPGAISKLRKPISLSEELDRTAGSSRDILDLGVRFKLARKLVQSIYLLHAAGWVHKNIRSKSVLFIPDRSWDQGPSKTGRKDYLSPVICGFGRSRPQLEHLFRGASREAGNIDLDIYQHPEKRLVQTRPYTRGCDVYSLGCVLLEIGFWQSLQSFDPGDSYEAYEFRNRLIGLTHELVGQVGSIYAGVVRQCLNIEIDCASEKLQEILCWKVAAALDQCMA